jgi:ABC-2 type transport system ATP-binding protein
MVFEERTADLERKAKEMGLEIGPISLQELFIHLTEESE